MTQQPEGRKQDILNFLASCNDDERLADLDTFIETLEEPIIAFDAAHQTGEAIPGSCIGGTNCEIPLDKNGTQMVLFGQLDFEELAPILDCLPVKGSELPARGVITLYISRNYNQLRAKDSGWFKIHFREAHSQADGGTQNPRVRLKARLANYLPCSTGEKLYEAICSQSDHNRNGKNGALARISDFIDRFNEHLVGTDYILGEPDNAAKEACVIAAFHANGISYDDKRRNDSCYHHLVEDAASWRVLWKSGLVSLVFPEEKRELYICVRSDDLQNRDFGKCRPVFL